MFEEKRKFKRFKGKKGAFAAFIRNNEFVITGKIQDIGMGGMCVRYLSTKEDKKRCSEMKIFGGNGRFIRVNKVQCRIVYDQEVPEYSWGRCGVAFKNLSATHLSLLQDFIDNFTFGEIPPRSPRA
jgi:hypothetical protein